MAKLSESHPIQPSMATRSLGMDARSFNPHAEVGKPGLHTHPSIPPSHSYPSFSGPYPGHLSASVLPYANDPATLAHSAPAPLKVLSLASLPPLPAPLTPVSDDGLDEVVPPQCRSSALAEEPLPAPVPRRPTVLTSFSGTFDSWRSDASSVDGSPSLPSPIVEKPSSLATIPMYPVETADESARKKPINVSLRAVRQKPPTVKDKAQVDPYAADFIRDHLGEEKWTIFSSKLSEGKRNSFRSRTKAMLSSTFGLKSAATFDVDSRCASAVEFLVKVEIVKGVLRTFVPLPSNPQKTLMHPYPKSPDGHVTLSRSSVLFLAGWSNTQFAYWARRVEGVSVLYKSDPRLRAVARVLHDRLSELNVPTGGELPALHGSDENETHTEEYDIDPERWVRKFVTGKGLDILLDEVKNAKGLSPFLRGKHSSLDPFGTTIKPSPSTSPTANLAPTFQAEMYVHHSPTSNPYSVTATHLNKSISADSAKSDPTDLESPRSPGSTQPPITPIASSSSWEPTILSEEPFDYYFAPTPVAAPSSPAMYPSTIFPSLDTFDNIPLTDDMANTVPIPLPAHGWCFSSGGDVDVEPLYKRARTDSASLLDLGFLDLRPRPAPTPTAVES